MAVSLALDLNRLEHIRASLRQWMLGSALCDGASFSRGVDQAYRSMWREHCAGSAGSSARPGGQ